MDFDDKAPVAALRSSLQRVQDDLSLPELVALLTIASEPGLSVNELSERISAPQQSTSRFVAILLQRYVTPVQSGDLRPFIVQQVKQDDPRSRALYLAERGQDVVNDILRAASRDLKESRHVGG